MKRPTRIMAAGAVLLVLGYLGFPMFFQYVDAWARHKPIPNRPTLDLSEVGPPSHYSHQPGLSFFQDLDEVRFVYSRSFDGDIEITVRRPPSRKGEQPHPYLYSVIYQPWKPKSEQYFSAEKQVSEEVFTELRNFIVRQDLIAHSLTDKKSGFDGSTWTLEGKKGSFVIRHIRWCPQDTDLEFVAIGKRFLDLADIKIPQNKFY